MQDKAKQVTSGTVNALAFANANASGNLIVVYVVWGNTGAVSLSDARANTYTSATGRTTWGNNWSSQVFYAKSIAAGTNTVTATFATTINSFALIYIHEYSGVDKVSPVDVSQSATGSGSAMSTGAVVTTNAADLLFAGAASEKGVTSGGSGYTTRSTRFGNRTLDRNVSAAGSYSATASQNGTAWVMQLVAFKADTGASDGTPPSVSITAPGNGAQVSGIVNVIADASDDVSVAGVQFLVDGNTSGVEDTSAPYGLAWDTRTLANGTHTLRARARDGAGNTALSPVVTVNVANASSFRNEVLATGFDLPTAIKFLPDGRMLVVELQGKIRVLSPPYTSADPTPFLQLTNIGSAGVQQGIYDLVLDPGFTTNHLYYIFYTLGSPNRDRLSRFTANSTLTGTVAGSELVLYQDPQAASSEHHGGALNFGNDGKLYFTTGEHFDAAAAQSLSNPRGKIHRINPDGTVPTDNPFFDGTGPNWDSIWALGLRNPYRAYYDAPTGRLYVGDVGGNDNRSSQEELDVGARGANFGWPDSEGSCSAPCTSPIYSYPHANRDACITGGFVYHGNQFPSSYVGSYFFADYTQNWIRRLTFDASGNVNGVYNFEPMDGSVDGPYGDIVYLTEGPDGALYYVDLGYSDISGTFGVSKIRRISYVSDNQPPVAAASANPRSGPAPLTVTFSSSGSSDPEGQPLTYEWTFGDGATSTAANPSHSYAQAGQYTARLSVSDGANTSQAQPLSITVGSPPTASILSPRDGSPFRAGDVISFSGDASDTEDGQLPASAFTWNIDFLHEGHVHPGTPITGVKSGTFAIPTSGHDFSGNTRYRITLTVADSDGLSTSSSVLIIPDKVNLSFATVPSGLTLYLDGIAKTTPFVYDDLIGFTHTIEARNQTSGGTSYAFELVVGRRRADAQHHGAEQRPDLHGDLPRGISVDTELRPGQQRHAAEPAEHSDDGLYQGAGRRRPQRRGRGMERGDRKHHVRDGQQREPLPGRGAHDRGSGLSQAVYYAPAIAAGANTVTVTFDKAVTYADVRILEYGGLDASSPVDVSHSAVGSTTRPTVARRRPTSRTSCCSVLVRPGPGSPGRARDTRAASSPAPTGTSPKTEP